MTFDTTTLRAFADAARRFCAFVEAADTMTLDARVLAVRRHLAELILLALSLPDGDASAPEVDSEPALPASWPGFGEHDVYWEVYDPYEHDDPVCGSLSDDVLDIYLDLRRGLDAYDRGNVGGAAWEWRFSFDAHWGDHAVDALRALHRVKVP